jgi:succinyl-diaminopimelate desuccinylase
MTTLELIEQVKRLVAIPSTGDNPEALQHAVDFVADFVAHTPGVTIERFESNGKPSFLAYVGERPARFDVLLNAHVDVVGAKQEQFEPYEKDGRLYGRGTLDMKGTALALANVFCELADAVPYKLGLQVVSDEELGGQHGVKYQIGQGVRADFVVMGEYANHPHTIYNAARGLCWAEIGFKGKAAHGGHLWNGNNALLAATQFASQVLTHYPTPDKETWTTTANIANIFTTNETFNRVPDQAVLKIDFRFTQEDPVFQSRENLEAFFHGINPNAEILSLSNFEPAVYAEELNPYVQGLSNAYSDQLGVAPQYLGRPGGSDGRHFAAVQIDVVEFGLYGQGSHSDHEYVELQSFDDYQKVMRAFLKNPRVQTKKTAIEKAASIQVRIMEDLVAMPSTTSDQLACRVALDYIERYLEERGMFTRRYEQNGVESLVATIKANDKQPTVMLTGHVDVVPAPDHMFMLTTKEGNYYGRGVYDMKFAIASYLALVDQLKDNLADYDFGIMITTDEEVGGANGMKVLVDEGYLPKVAIAPDGGDNWQIQEIAKGVQWIKLTARGTAGHASQPWKTDNAIHKLLAAVTEIQALVPEQPTIDDPFRTSLSIGLINGGEATNQAAPEASAMIDIRFGSAQDYESIPLAIKNICAKHGIEIETPIDDKPTSNPLDDPYIAAFKQAISNHIDYDPGRSKRFAATDARYFNFVGIPAVIVSPEGGDCHSENEWLSAASYEQFLIILHEYITTVAKIDQSQDPKQQAIEQLAKHLQPDSVLQ